MKISKMAAAFVVAGLASSLAMAEGPAVSGINGKISAQGGDMNGKSASSGDAVIAVPLGQSFGFQLDGSTGRFLNSDYGGYGGHLFWRDPSRGLVGLVASTQKLGNLETNRNGVEGEAYINNFSLSMRGGRQSGDAGQGGYIGAGGRWYISDNLVLNLGYGHMSDGIDITGLGMEWQPTNWGTRGLSLFVRGNESTGGNHAATIGVRFYFDENKSLIQRHRTADPESIVMPLGDVIPTPTIRVPAPALAPAPLRIN